VPRILKTVAPRIRKSIEERGLLTSAFRSVLLPVHLLREYRETRLRDVPTERSEFDREHGVETDGEFAGWTYLSDLEIPSANWIRGSDYTPIWPERLHAGLALVPVKFEDFVFVDFGSGKGRAILIASEYPFKRVIGIEFSPQLHAMAQRNIAKYQPRKCAVVESVCADFLECPLPPEPLVLFFFHPCDRASTIRIMTRIAESLRAHPRELYLIYVAPPAPIEQVLDSAECLTKVAHNSDRYIHVYKGR